MPDWYENYLETPHWRHIRERKINQAGGVCNRCGVQGRLFEHVWYGVHVHHLTYERIGSEHLSDLEVLCVACHKLEHGLIQEDDRGSVMRRENTKVTCRYIEYDWDLDEIGREVAAWDDLARSADL